MKWESEAGPRQTKQVNQALSDLNWHMKGEITLTGIVGKPETEKRSHHTVCVLGGGGGNEDERGEALNAIGEKFNWLLTRENYRDVIAACEEAKANWEPPVIDERKTEAELAERDRAIAEMDAKREEESRKHAAEVTTIAAELRTKYPWAVGPNEMRGGKEITPWARAAANIRHELARKFPGVKFSVRARTASMMDAVDVRWTLGPTTAQVNEVIGKYQDGSFNAMNDMYEHDHSAFKSAVEQVLGGAKYVSGDRDYPDEYVERVGKMLCDAQNVEYVDQFTPHLFGAGDQKTLRDHVWQLLQHTPFPKCNPYPTGVEDADETSVETPPDWPCHLLPYRLVFPTSCEGGSCGEQDRTFAAQGAEVQRHFHTKRQIDFWLVVAKMTREDFDRIRSECRAAGGWYSRKWGTTPGGFAFENEEDANGFAVKHFGNSEQIAA
jgi:hypothetical protein